LIFSGRVYERAQTAAKIDEEFLNQFIKMHPILYNYRILPQELEVVRTQVSTHLTEKFREEKASSKLRKLFNRFFDCKSLTGFYKQFSKKIFPLYYCFDEAREHWKLSAQELDLLKRFLDLCWELENLNIILEKKVEQISYKDKKVDQISNEDIQFVNEIRYNPVPYLVSISKLKYLRKNGFSGLIELTTNPLYEHSPFY
jgi:hypothetical protein